MRTEDKVLPPLYRKGGEPDAAIQSQSDQIGAVRPNDRGDRICRRVHVNPVHDQSTGDGGGNQTDGLD
ncbi:hypothetical protein D3C73_1597890 [compost metagenome]